MVFKTPVKKTRTPIKIKSSPKPKLKSITKPHHHRRRKSTSPFKTLASAGFSALSASIKSCRRRLPQLFCSKNGFHRLISVPVSPIKQIEPCDQVLPPTCKKTLFLDLDETLVHSKTDPPPEKYDFKVYPVIGGRVIPFYVLKRPGLDEFLRVAAESSFEIVVFTAGLKEYASLVLDQLDPTNQLITHRLYRDACRQTEPGRFVKDLTLTERRLNQSVIIDDNPNAYMLQPDNAIPVKPFLNDLQDNELRKMVTFFGVCEKFDDLRDAVKYFRNEFGKEVGVNVV
ncbi:hypothetical protein LUZ60_009686 [Juncus effusus]|nr:hypothetical protein LUZ60_009686 [Juncus effusus]